MSRYIVFFGMMFLLMIGCNRNGSAVPEVQKLDTSNVKSVLIRYWKNVDAKPISLLVNDPEGVKSVLDWMTNNYTPIPQSQIGAVRPTCMIYFSESSDFNSRIKRTDLHMTLKPETSSGIPQSVMNGLFTLSDKWG